MEKVILIGLVLWSIVSAGVGVGSTALMGSWHSGGMMDHDCDYSVAGDMHEECEEHMEWDYEDGNDECHEHMEYGEGNESLHEDNEYVCPMMGQ